MAISFEYDLTYPGPTFPIARVMIAGRNGTTVTHAAFLDTGADATVIPFSILKQVNARRLDRAFARNMDGSRYEIMLYAVKVTIGSYPIDGIEAIANDKTSEIILSRDALNQLVVTLNGLAETTYIEH